MSRRPRMSMSVFACTLCCAACLSACSGASRSRATADDAASDTAATPNANPSSLMGRWILVPGDCVMPEPTDTEAADASKAVVSPAGAVLVLAGGGGMSSHQDDFIRKGTWKFDGTTLRIVVEPPPRRIEMGFQPTVEASELRLMGADGMVLVYHRDPFIAVQAPAGASHTP